MKKNQLKKEIKDRPGLIRYGGELEIDLFNMSEYPVGSIGWENDIGLFCCQSLAQRVLDAHEEWYDKYGDSELFCEAYLAQLCLRLEEKDLEPALIISAHDVHLFMKLTKGSHEGKYVHLQAYPGFTNLKEDKILIEATIKSELRENADCQVTLWNKEFSFKGYEKIIELIGIGIARYALEPIRNLFIENHFEALPQKAKKCIESFDEMVISGDFDWEYQSQVREIRSLFSEEQFNALPAQAKACFHAVDVIEAETGYYGDYNYHFKIGQVGYPGDPTPVGKAAYFIAESLDTTVKFIDFTTASFAKQLDPLTVYLAFLPIWNQVDENGKAPN